MLIRFYGTPVYFGMSTFPLHFADLLTWWRLGNRKPTQQQTTQLDPGATGTHRARRGPFPCLAWLETSTAVARRNQVKSDTDDYPALDHLKRAKWPNSSCPHTPGSWEKKRAKVPSSSFGFVLFGMREVWFEKGKMTQFLMPSYPRFVREVRKGQRVPLPH